ncbi:hypothetical protein A4A49_63138, partial [Nicotiana attenuata]
MLNNLFSNDRYKGYFMNGQGPKINHLSFADDTIIFYSSMKYSLQLTLKTLTKYDKVPANWLTKAKVASLCLLGQHKVPSLEFVILGLRYDHFLMKYLGCPLHPGRKKLAFYSDMVSKVINMIMGWHLKFLSFGGRATLVRHVLLALNIHMLAAIHPPKGTIDMIE